MHSCNKFILVLLSIRNWSDLNDLNEIDVILNTDGISPFKSSCVTIWPVIMHSLVRFTPYCTYEQGQHDYSSTVGWKVEANNVCFTGAGKISFPQTQASKFGFYTTESRPFVCSQFYVAE